MRHLHRRIAEPARGNVDLIPWISWLFVIGSACFAVAVPISLVPNWPIVVSGTIYFVGSVFFTSAASLQLLGCVNETSVAGGPRDWLQPHRREWLSDVSQWIGTLFFNVSTFRGAYLHGLSVQSANRLVWAPDAIGSALFLISSILACRALAHAPGRQPSRDLEWRINAVNLGGSALFGIAAVGALVLPTTSDLYNVRWANVGTCAGALCFLVAARWLRREDPTFVSTAKEPVH